MVICYCTTAATARPIVALIRFCSYGHVTTPCANVVILTAAAHFI